MSNSSSSLVLVRILFGFLYNLLFLVHVRFSRSLKRAREGKYADLLAAHIRRTVSADSAAFQRENNRLGFRKASKRGGKTLADLFIQVRQQRLIIKIQTLHS